jgi:hypothetical protein
MAIRPPPSFSREAVPQTKQPVTFFYCQCAATMEATCCTRSSHAIASIKAEFLLRQGVVLKIKANLPI